MCPVSEPDIADVLPLHKDLDSAMVLLILVPVLYLLLLILLARKVRRIACSRLIMFYALLAFSSDVLAICYRHDLASLKPWFAAALALASPWLWLTVTLCPQ